MADPPQADADVRMRGFARRSTVDTALAWLDQRLQPLDAESVGVDAAAGRVLAESITSAVDVPSFDRAMMDGFAVRAANVEGATAYNRLSLRVVGEAFPGRPFAGTLAAGEAVKIMTGAAIPHGADAVLPAEVVEIAPADPGGSPIIGGAPRGYPSPRPADAYRIFVQGDVSPGKNIGRRAEDVAVGDKLFSAGRVLRPQDVGVLASIGLASVMVVRGPRVWLVITGDELLPAGSTPRDCRIADANGPMLAALVARDGGVVAGRQIVSDDRQAIREAIAGTDDTAYADVTIVSGGSSVGQEDHAPTLLAELGELAIHGIAMRPSSPTGMGRIGNRLVFLLPGNPVSCLCAYDFFAGRALRALGGRSRAWPYRSRRAVLGRNLNSVVGRVDYARVKFVLDRVEPLAIAGASILSSTTRADGFVIIPADSEGFPAGSEVDVFLYD